MLLDAFGWAFVQRHADHPFLRRLEIEPVASQFPSTTTAHLTTLYTGLPVAEHGLYEWRRLRTGAGRRRSSRCRSSPRTGAAGPRPAASWSRGRRCSSSSRSRRAYCSRRRSRPASTTRAAFAGATVEPYERFEAAVGAAAGHARAHPPLLGPHRRRRPPLRPVEPEFAAASRGGAGRAGDAPRHVRRRHRRPRADRRRRRSTIWTSSGRRCSSTLRHPPAGLRPRLLPARRPTRRPSWASSPPRLGERAEVRLAAELFPDAGPRLQARLADVCVLPAPGRMAWLQAYPSRQLEFRGHHGGLTRGGVGDLGRHDAAMNSGVSYTALEPDTEERFVSLRRALGVTTFGINQIILRPGQRGRIHRHTTQEEVYLVLDGTLTLVFEDEVDELGQGRDRPRRARRAPLHRQPASRGRAADRARRRRSSMSAATARRSPLGRHRADAPPQDLPLPPDEPVRGA